MFDHCVGGCVMNKMMAGLALLVSVAMATESGTAQMTMSGTGLTSGTSVQQTLDKSQSSLNNTGTSGVTSGSMSSLSIDRFETRSRRLYAVVSLSDFLNVSGWTPGMVVSVPSTQLSTPGTVVYMDGRYSAGYNDTFGISLQSGRTGIV